MTRAVKVTSVYFDGRPNRQVTEKRPRQALTDTGHPMAPVEYRQIGTPEQATAAEFRGSPTVLVNDRDPFLDRDSPVGLSRRIYHTSEGLAGSPTVEQLVTALR